MMGIIVLGDNFVFDKVTDGPGYLIYDGPCYKQYW